MSKPAFSELITAFLRDKMAAVAARLGDDSPEYQALARQYLRTPDELFSTPESNLRHYEADASNQPGGPLLPGLERLYRRTVVVEPTLACAAHCRYCIRAHYPRHNLSEAELRAVAAYCGHPANRDDLTEVLITGGDPLLVPDRVEYLLRHLAETSPNIRVARIATRIPLQDPALISDQVLRLFQGGSLPRVELATQINHPVELFPEVVETFRSIMACGVRVYAQNVLLRGVNDRLNTLIDLYDSLRELGIEAHYLFHCVPLVGMGHLRTTLQRAVDLGNGLAGSGNISGRAKPLLAAMTDIGKIILYDGVIIARQARHVLLRSMYHPEDRRRWNPAWQIPMTAELDRNGCLRVWYLDGSEAEAATDQRPRRSPSDWAPAESESSPLTTHHPVPLPLIQHCA